MLRDGRFEGSMDSKGAEYSTSLEEDMRLFETVLRINMAHLRMLKKEGVIEGSEADQILDALSELAEEGVEALDLRPELEDIHMAIEEYVEEKVGEDTAGKLHTAKSRNDQVSAAVRMVLREEILDIQEIATGLIENLMELARDHTGLIMPGYTHLQVAEPTTFGHYLSSYVQAFIRDIERLGESFEKTNRSPLGACALAGTSFPIDRKFTSEVLGFDEVLENTIDATGARDFALQAMSDMAIIMSNLSRFTEELIVWSSAEFDMVEIPDEFATTSSIMPQKKNPEVAELARAKSSRVSGNLIGALGIMKSLTQAYNLDLQELTPLLWDSVDQTKESLDVIKDLVSGLEPKPENMKKNAQEGFAASTELANTLVRESEIPFRKAHQIVGRLSAKAIEEGKKLHELTLEDLNEASKDAVGEEVQIPEDKLEESLDLEKCVESRELVGGPSPKSVKESLSKFRERLESLKDSVGERKDSLPKNKEDILED